MTRISAPQGAHEGKDFVDVVDRRRLGVARNSALGRFGGRLWLGCGRRGRHGPR